MELTRAERRERVKAFHAHIAHRAALLLPLAKTIKPEAMPAETDPPTWVARQKEIWFSIVDEVEPPQQRNVRIEEIQRVVAGHFGLSRADLISERRMLPLVRPRQIAMYFARHYTRRTLPEIGRRFGGKDHTTVLHGVRKITRELETDEQLAADVAALRTVIDGML